MPEGPRIRQEADKIARVLAGQRADAVFFAFDHLRPFVATLQERTASAGRRLYAGPGCQAR